MSRLICKKGLVLFLFPHRTYVLDFCKNRLTEAILTNIQNVCFFKVLNTIFLHNLINCYLLSEGFVTVKLIS